MNIEKGHLREHIAAKDSNVVIRAACHIVVLAIPERPANVVSHPMMLSGMISINLRVGSHTVEYWICES